MARLPGFSAPGLPHHLIQRGNNRQTIFVDEVDCTFSCGELASWRVAHGLAIHATC